MILDSDILIYFLKGNTKIVDEVLKLSNQELFITRINYTELLYGAYNSTKVEENLKKIRPFLEKFTILEFDEISSEIFAKIKSKLKKDGNIIADMDLMIASICIANDQELATNNHKHFERIKDLKIVKWL
ncbi:PIN domain nuclease [Arcobacter sp. FW59]|nr:PIN domain nuclease [Arcobacter sp. FW59]